MVTPKGKCEQWQCHATRDQVPQPNAALDGLPNRSVWERLKSATCGHLQTTGLWRHYSKIATNWLNQSLQINIRKVNFHTPRSPQAGSSRHAVKLMCLSHCPSVLQVLALSIHAV